MRPKSSLSVVHRNFCVVLNNPYPYLERKSSVACIRYGSLFTLKQTNHIIAEKTILLMALNKVTLDSRADDVLRYEMDR